MRRKHLIPKNVETAITVRNEEEIYKKILVLFKEERGGIYRVAQRKGILGNNLYPKIRSCAEAIVRIQSVLKLADYEMKYVFLKKEELKDHTFDWWLEKKRS